jgi:hypothetical protein
MKEMLTMKYCIISISLLLILSLVACAGKDQPSELTLKNSADTTLPCDLESAHPADPQRFAPGKEDHEIVPVLGVQACMEAAKQFPSTPRFQFQLGRALLAMKRTEESEAQFAAAYSAGYKQAGFYLGESKLKSYWESESLDDFEKARELLIEASGSFPPADERLTEITFDANLFAVPHIAQALYDEDYETLNRARLLTALYLRGMHDFLATEFNPENNDCPAYIVDPSITFNLDRAVEGDPRNTLEGAKYYLVIKAAEIGGKFIWDPVWKGKREKWVEYYQGLGRRDGQFIAHHQGCSSPVTARLYRNLTTFSRLQRPLSEYAEGMLRGDAKALFEKPVDQAVAKTDLD